MGQVRHGCATTTHAVRAAIQRSQASTAELSRELGINPKTVAKWRKRQSVEDRRTGPKEPHSTVLSEEEEAVVVAFRQHTLLPLDDCLYALQPTIPYLTRSSLHRCLQRHGISRLPDMDGDKPKKQRFKRYPIGFFHIDISELRTTEGKLYLFVAIDRTSKFAEAPLVEQADLKTRYCRLITCFRLDAFKHRSHVTSQVDLAGVSDRKVFSSERDATKNPSKREARRRHFAQIASRALQYSVPNTASVEMGSKQ